MMRWVAGAGQSETPTSCSRTASASPTLPSLPIKPSHAAGRGRRSADDGISPRPTTRSTPTPLLQTAKRFPPTRVRMPTEPPHPFLCSFPAATLYSHAFSEKDANIFRKKVGNAPLAGFGKLAWNPFCVDEHIELIFIYIEKRTELLKALPEFRKDGGFCLAVQ
jgi:hypothetical protein